MVYSQWTVYDICCSNHCEKVLLCTVQMLNDIPLWVIYFTVHSAKVVCYALRCANILRYTVNSAKTVIYNVQSAKLLIYTVHCAKDVIYTAHSTKVIRNTGNCAKIMSFTQFSVQCSVQKLFVVPHNLYLYILYSVYCAKVLRCAKQNTVLTVPSLQYGAVQCSAKVVCKKFGFVLSVR